MADINLPLVALSSYASLSAAVTAIGATPTTLMLDTTSTVSADLTIPATLNVVAMKTGIITVAAAKTLTINGPFDAGLYQAFSCQNSAELAPALTGASGVNWTFAGTYTTPLNNTIVKAGAGTDTITPTAATTIVAGQMYKVVITTSAFTAGSFSYTLGGASGTTVSAAKTTTDHIIATTTGKLIITPTDAARFTISGISIISLGKVVFGDNAVKEVYPQWWGAQGDCALGVGGTDNYAAITAAIASLNGTGGTIRLVKGQYRTTGKLVLTSGARLIGDGYMGYANAAREGTTSIFADHAGEAVLSLRGANSCTVADLSLEAAAGAVPKVGLLLGRSSASSAGFHKINKVSVYGYYSVAGIYSIASEVCLWQDIMVWLFGVDSASYALYGFVTAEEDVFAVDSLTASTNLGTTVINLSVVSAVDSASAACIYMYLGASTGSWTFLGGYLTPYKGAYVRMASGATSVGPFTFMGLSGERFDSGAVYPTVGFDLTAASPYNLPGLTIQGCRLVLPSSATGKIIQQSSNLTLYSPNIVFQRSEVFPYATADIDRSKIKGGIVDVGNSSQFKEYKSIFLKIEDGTGANTIKVTTTSNYDGDAIGATDNIGKGATTGNFSLDASGGILKLLAAGMADVCVGVLSVSVAINSSALTFAPYVYVDTGDLRIDFYDGTPAAVDLTTIASGKYITLLIGYVTNWY